MIRPCLHLPNARFLSRSHGSHTSIRRNASSKSTPSPHPPLHSRFLNRISPHPTTLTTVRTLTTYTLAAFLTWHITTSYFYTLSPCYGISMLPTLNSYGDWVLISKYYRRGRGVQVGDLVSFAHPVDEGIGSVKRVIGLEGDFVLVGSPGTDRCIQLPQGHCWVVGDNLPHSRDSRLFGPLPMALIRGKVIASVTPWTTVRRIENGLRDVGFDLDDEDGVD